MDYTMIFLWIKNNILDLITSIATAIAAIAAAQAAKYSKNAVIEQKKESLPFLVIDHVEASLLKEYAGYPVYIYLTNIGKGVARVLAVDLFTKEIRADIGTPISVALSGITHVKIWLREKEVTERICFSMYYWDIDMLCYRTEFDINLRVTLMDTGGFYASYGQNKEQMLAIGKKDFPDNVLHWPRDSYFEEPWWQ